MGTVNTGRRRCDGDQAPAIPRIPGPSFWRWLVSGLHCDDVVFHEKTVHEADATLDSRLHGGQCLCTGDMYANLPPTASSRKKYCCLLIVPLVLWKIIIVFIAFIILQSLIHELSLLCFAFMKTPNVTAFLHNIKMALVMSRCVVLVPRMFIFCSIVWLQNGKSDSGLLSQKCRTIFASLDHEVGLLMHTFKGYSLVSVREH